MDVTIHHGGKVYVDGQPLTTEKESALANIILRLNASNRSLRKKAFDMEQNGGQLITHDYTQNEKEKRNKKS